MKIFNASRLREIENATVKSQNITMSQLVERAAQATHHIIDQRLFDYGYEGTSHIFCGVGNNGADGLALACNLLTAGHRVEVYIVNFSDRRSPEFLYYLDRLKNQKYWPKTLKEEQDFPELPQGELVVDAIFGTGLNRDIPSWVASLIKQINQLQNFVFSVDIPSGLFMDRLPSDPQAVIKAQTVVTFAAPKLIFFLPFGGQYVQSYVVCNLGFDVMAMQETPAEAIFVQKSEARLNYKSRHRFTHKGDYGHALLIGGSYGKTGALILAAEACLKSGAGKVTTFSPQIAYLPLQTRTPEIMLLTDADEKIITKIECDFEPTVAVIGMGLGTHPKTAMAFVQYLEHNKTPAVIDADGLNLLAENPDLINKLPAKTVLTPHPGELKRLIGRWQDDFDKIKKVKKFVKKYDVVMVAKDAYTLICFEDQLFVNSSGNPGMATAGSGDVLAGIIGGLMAQQYAPSVAAILGVYLHGVAGDFAADEMGFEALHAGAITNNLGEAFGNLWFEEENDDDDDDDEDD